MQAPSNLFQKLPSLHKSLNKNEPTRPNESCPPHPRSYHTDAKAPVPREPSFSAGREGVPRRTISCSQEPLRLAVGRQRENRVVAGDRRGGLG
jgi:hypothetical protein